MDTPWTLSMDPVCLYVALRCSWIRSLSIGEAGDIFASEGSTPLLIPGVCVVMSGDLRATTGVTLSLFPISDDMFLNSKVILLMIKINSCYCRPLLLVDE